MKGKVPARIVIDDPGYDPSKAKAFLNKVPERIKSGPAGVIMAKLHNNDCPVCEARRVKQIEAQKRYREKKNA